MIAAIGFIFGLVLGAMTGSEMGAFGFAALGMLVGASIQGYGWMRAHLVDEPTLERHRVMCTPFGHSAELELVGDPQRGRWVDVKSCSLLRPATEVDCDKGCVRLINLAGVRPGRGCSCEDAGSPQPT